MASIAVSAVLILGFVLVAKAVPVRISRNVLRPTSEVIQRPYPGDRHYNAHTFLGDCIKVQSSRVPTVIEIAAANQDYELVGFSDPDADCVGDSMSPVNFDPENKALINTRIPILSFRLEHPLPEGRRVTVKFTHSHGFIEKTFDSTDCFILDPSARHAESIVVYEKTHDYERPVHKYISLFSKQDCAEKIATISPAHHGGDLLSLTRTNPLRVMTSFKVVNKYDN